MPAIVWRLAQDAPQLTRTTLIGIIVAITGNVLISFALNLQKLAHRRLDASAKTAAEQSSTPAFDRSQAETFQEATNGDRERQVPDAGPDYGTLPAPNIPRPRSGTPSSAAAIPVSPEETTLLSSPASLHKAGATEGDWDESRYLKSKLWWLGFLLMNVGEGGNFMSYAFAPASVVAPLGTFALIANCIFAPFMLGERFKKRDLVGIALATTGAITVVLSSNSSESRMTPDALRKAVAQWPFIIYSSICASGAVVLATLSHRELGQKWVFIDVGLCAIFGGFTVLSTKALSTLLTTEWVDMLAEWITYPVLLVFAATGVGQIRYLNRALMRFDSKVVIPIQFVLFTLSAIIGSAILYGDFRKATFHQTVTFLYGVATTFAGVFTIAWAPGDHAGDTEPPDSASRSSSTGSPDYRLNLGKRRPAFAHGAGSEGPALRNRRSTLDMIGLSPAKHLLLVEREQLNEFASGPEVLSSSYRPRTSSSLEPRGNPRLAGPGERTGGKYSRDDMDLSGRPHDR